MLPAKDGDCLLLTWGRSTELHHLIVDLGREGTYRAVKDRLVGLSNIELFVMSHIDADHIAGAVPLVKEAAAPFAPARVWYNARPQLQAAHHRQSVLEAFGARQGEKLARGIVNFGWPWNAEFASEIVSVDSPEAQEPISLPGGLTIRLLSPRDEDLVALIPVWDGELEKEGLRSFDPDRDDDPLSDEFEPFGGAPEVESLAEASYQRDKTKPNGTSIAFIAEFEGKRVLLAADAHSEVLEAALRPLAEAEGGTYRVDLLKVSHHGSKANTSKDFPRLIDCIRFAISTDGSRHHHPDAALISRFLAADPARPKKFYFNYRQDSTDIWDSAALRGVWNYEVEYPSDDEDHAMNGTLTIDLFS
ncbi:hypothetical protein FEM03_06040 [Phragmitibacter flavus]|uniref:MBL fold metallo-hydrolase n=1 Tax=Phragmitibacter flavus TaxID=2576071 RepID=A0A5R8KHF0_9BACT|nr:hypothetical protein [Phragmitibacter flavus]TLD71697.1 hypothetical protein FEM03_06040 [Phragmitibacter flavus]